MINFFKECRLFQRRLIEDTKYALAECHENLRWKVFALLGRGACILGYRVTALRVLRYTNDLSLVYTPCIDYGSSEVKESGTFGVQ